MLRLNCEAPVVIARHFLPRLDGTRGVHVDAEDDHAITAHVEAWGDLLCTAAGLPPVPPGVVAMRRLHRHR